MRKGLLFVALLFGVPFTSRAQVSPDLEVFGGYSYLRVDKFGNQTVGLNGWNVSATVSLKGRLGLTADLSNWYGAPAETPIGTQGGGFTYLFGPQYSFRTVPRVTPFVHALFGGVHGKKFLPVPLAGGACPVNFPNCGGFSVQPETAFAAAFGGGLDVKAVNHVWIRLFQVDYVRANLSVKQNDVRVSTGVVFRLGRT